MMGEGEPRRLCHALMLREEQTAGMGISGILQCGIHSCDEMKVGTLAVTSFLWSNHAKSAVGLHFFSSAGEDFLFCYDAGPPRRGRHASVLSSLHCDQWRFTREPLAHWRTALVTSHKSSGFCEEQEIKEFEI